MRRHLHFLEHLEHLLHHLWGLLAWLLVVLCHHLLEQLHLRRVVGVLFLFEGFIILDEVLNSFVILLIVVVGAHRVRLKLLLGELRHWQVVLRKDTNLNVTHVSTCLCFEHCGVIETFYF